MPARRWIPWPTVVPLQYGGYLPFTRCRLRAVLCCTLGLARAMFARVDVRIARAASRCMLYTAPYSPCISRLCGTAYHSHRTHITPHEGTRQRDIRPQLPPSMSLHFWVVGKVSHTQYVRKQEIRMLSLRRPAGIYTICMQPAVYGCRAPVFASPGKVTGGVGAGCGVQTLVTAYPRMDR